MIRSGVSLSQESISAIAKEMSSTKAATRRAFFEIVGIVLYNVAEPETDEASVLPALEGIGKAISQVLENSLKNISANPTAANAVPGEGYTAVFALLRWQKIPTFKAAVSKNAVLQSLATSSVKPSFLLWDKVYHKLSTENDERWLLYALEAAMLHYSGELEKNGSVRLQFGTALTHLSVESSHIGTRKQSHLALQRLTLRIPELLHRTVRETFAVHISKESAPDDAQLWRTRVARRFSILTSIVSFSDQTDPMLKEGLLSELLIIAHHPEISPYPRQGWIELSQKAGLDPRQLVTSTENRLFEIILSSLTETGSIATAGATSATTIAFIAPDLTVDRLVQQVQKDLDVAQLNKIGPTEIAIWKTDEGTLYEDVLSSKKNSSTNIQKGKNQDIEKWEADLRKSLAAKKSSSSAAMSKQDKALVDAQLEKEAKIRKEVANVQSRLIRGLQLINSLIAAEVHEFQPYVATVATLLVDGILRKASFLVGELAFDTYLNLGKSCSPRLGSFNRWIGVATLRCFEIPVVPQELQEEDLSSLILRVLYRLRTLAEQLPFDPPTYSYTSPLLTFVIRSTGVGTTEPDIVDEQIALALNVVGDHSGECSNSAYPRLDMAKSLIYAIGHHQKFNKDASSSLAAWGQAASTSSTPQDARAIVEATLSQEVYVRSACLQALQPFDLTDLEWSPELWLACHDDDEQNAR
ncbi:translational activator of GCN4, partial [Tulasnella sp. 419]